MSNSFNTKIRRTGEADAKIFDELSRQVVDSAYKVHHYFGAGLLETIYEEALCLELKRRNILVERQKSFNVFYEGKKLDALFKADIVVENQIILELKSVEKIINAHKAQILSYLNITNIETGFIMNFGDPYFKRAIERFVLSPSRPLYNTSGASC